jgi:hypothetical protein
MSIVEAPKRQAPRGTRPCKPTKPMPLTRDNLDSRSAAAKLWDRMATDITSDLGGEENLSTIQRTLINAFCAVSIQLTDLSTQSLLGKPVALSDLSLAASTLVRLAVRLGISRQPRTVGESLGELLRADHAKQQREKQDA